MSYLINFNRKIVLGGNRNTHFERYSASKVDDMVNRLRSYGL